MNRANNPVSTRPVQRAAGEGQPIMKCRVSRSDGLPMTAEFNIRRGTPSDTRAAFDVSMLAMKDLFLRHGYEWKLEPEAFWKVLAPFLTHLAEHAAQWWIAENRADGKLIGYARSVERDGLFELSELFVRPDKQSAGLGKLLLDKAFPSGRGEVRAIIATNDVRGVARYYGAGTAARFVLFSLTGQPRQVADENHEALRIGPAEIREFAEMEQAVVGYARHADYPWLLENREIYRYRNAGRTVGFGCFSEPARGRSWRWNPMTSAQSSATSRCSLTVAGWRAFRFKCPRSMSS